MILRSLLISFLYYIQLVSSAPQRSPDSHILEDDNSDFGVPHDNRVQTEINLTDMEIGHLMAEDYFTNSVLTCDNDTAPGRWMVYCSGRLLQAVMKVQLYKDSKTFVDQPMKKNMSGEIIIDAFDARFPGNIEKLTREEVRAFVDEYFDAEGHELDVCELPEWVPNPSKLEKIVDPTYRNFATRLHFIWIQLCRRMIPEVREEPERFSILYVPNNFILPGGRFREFYYWDAYWIVKGLLASQLYSTARSMLLNFAHIIRTYGFVPNGGRVYYLKRSQPPFFASMLYEYYEATRDLQLVRDLVPVVELEYTFWTEKRRTNVTMDDDDNTIFSMFQYRSEADTPRPESFREDVISAHHMRNTTERRRFFRNVASAAESGWDFSSRWFKDGHRLESIETMDIVPIDLNAFICYNMNILSFFYRELENVVKQTEWSARYRSFRDAFSRVFYVPSRRGWYDYNLRTRRHNVDFFPTIAIPLFTQCYDPLDHRIAVDVYKQMEATGAFDFEGGVPTSLRRESTQQWDFPNGWAPLNHMVIEGLRKSTNPMMQQKAFMLAERWLRANVATYNVSNAMWEKYNVLEPNMKLAGGGEYEVQAGFGWTNGVALDLLLSYSDRLTYKGDSLETLTPSTSPSDTERDLSSNSPPTIARASPRPNETKSATSTLTNVSILLPLFISIILLF